MSSLNTYWQRATARARSSRIARATWLRSRQSTLTLTGTLPTHLTTWALAGYTVPAADDVKRAVLARYGIPGSTWIETGTFRGNTTAFLADIATHVYSVEPEPDLARQATDRFATTRNVTIVKGLSEDHLDSILQRIDGPVSLWLDGHYSKGITHQGPVDTPIEEELRIVGQHLTRLSNVAIHIDDLRLFDPSNPAGQAYPSRRFLVDWADQHNLWWTIEHDIFVARTTSPFSSIAT